MATVLMSLKFKCKKLYIKGEKFNEKLMLFIFIYYLLLEFNEFRILKKYKIE